jgi:glycosyltransferase involved in cell wall biosynthesis
VVRFLLIEAYDFEGYPIGGSATFSDQIIRAFEYKVALVGITTCKSDVVGQWFKKTISGVEYDYFPVKYVKKTLNKKSFVPARLQWYLALKRYRKELENYGCINVFIQSPDTLLAIYNWKFNNICYSFAGLVNPLSMSKYRWARLFDTLFEKVYIPKLKFANTFLAAASKNDIQAYCTKVNRYGINLNIVQFPTRVDTNIFYPANEKEKLRVKLGYRESSKIIVTSGRLSEVKGWKLLLDSYNLFLIENPDSLFLFIGTGQDKGKIESYISELGIDGLVNLIGFLPKDQLAIYLNISDLYVMGSFFEGWPTSMVEAIACGIPICTTNFGSSQEILINEKIGLIAKTRNPKIFADKMNEAIRIPFSEQIHSQEMGKYSVKNLGAELIKYCNF